jgi:hypothetical protein
MIREMQREIRFCVVLAALAIACTGGPKQTYPGPPRPREDVAILRESPEAGIWAIDGVRTFGGSWEILSGRHAVLLEVRFYPTVSNLKWMIRTYCKVELEAAAGKTYESFARTHSEDEPTESLKLVFGITELGGRDTTARSCAPTRPSL